MGARVIYRRTYEVWLGIPHIVLTSMATHRLTDFFFQFSIINRKRAFLDNNGESVPFHRELRLFVSEVLDCLYYK